MVQLAWHFVVNNWSCISIMGMLGWLGGSIFTRRTMAPSFCPRCIRHQEWIKELKNGTEIVEESFIQKAIEWLKKKRGK